MTSSLHLWQAASLTYFVYTGALVVLPGIPARECRRRVLIGSAVGIAIVVLSTAGQPAVLTDWLWPPLVLLTSYWTSGWLVRGPVPAQERMLAFLDHRWNVAGIAGRTPRPVAELLEAAYLGVYLLVPLALLVHLAYADRPSAPGFWAVILVTDFICFGALPWVQTRPPRSLEPDQPWDSTLRRLNLRLLDSASVRMNTCPSGHAAEGLASALLVLDAPGWIAAGMLIAALAVSAGAVLGRYHYLIDALAGWVVAVGVWALVAL